MKNVLLSKYEDKWAGPRAAMLHSTCSDSYLSPRPAGLDRLQCIVHMGRWSGGVEEGELSSPLPSRLRARDSPLKPNDMRLTPQPQLIISPYLVMF